MDMAELDKETVVGLLNSILEAELAGVVRYTHYSFLVFGFGRIPIVSWLNAQAEESLTHARMAGEWVTTLGAHPSLGIGALLDSHQHDIGAILRESLQAEGEALELYRKLHHLHESPPNMAYPLLVLGVLSVIAGLALGFPPDHGLYHRFVAPIFEVAHGSEAGVEHAVSVGAEHAEGASEIVMAAVSLAVALAGIGLAYLFYVRRPDLPAALADKLRGLYNLLLNKYWVDELYQAIFIDFGKRFCRFLWGVDARVVDGAVNGSSWLTMRLCVISSWNDIKIVDGLVNAIADLIQGGSSSLRRLQTGAIQNYILAMALGIIGMVVFYLFI